MVNNLKVNLAFAAAPDRSCDQEHWVLSCLPSSRSVSHSSLSRYIVHRPPCLGGWPHKFLRRSRDCWQAATSSVRQSGTSRSSLTRPQLLRLARPYRGNHGIFPPPYLPRPQPCHRRPAQKHTLLLPGSATHGMHRSVCEHRPRNWPQNLLFMPPIACGDSSIGITLGRRFVLRPWWK